MSKIPQIKRYEGLPVVTGKKMKKIDLAAFKKYSIAPEILMENAGKALANETISFAIDVLSKSPKEINISVMCGRGNNGGDGLVCARYLKQAGVSVKIYIVSPSENGYSKLTADNIKKAKEAGIDIILADPQNITQIEEESSNYDLFIDALLGISAIGKPAGVVKRLIQIMNKTGKPIISADLPSGLNPDTGHHSGVFVKAAMTVTFGLPKTGLMAACAQKNIGKLKIAPIGYPDKLIEEAKY